jgi:hypothetical protein
MKQYEREASFKYIWRSNRNRDVSSLGERTVSDGILNPEEELA